MEKLQLELNQEKQLEKDRKNLIRQQQYEDYSNYFKQKYSQTPQTKENMNIKVGNEQDLFENQVINSKWKIYV